MTSSLRVVLITVPDDDEVAIRIAKTLVEERLCACVNVLPGVRSIYRWEGAVQVESERLLIAKTTVDKLDAVVARGKEIHPYSTPEIIALPVETGLADYLHWVETETETET